MPSALRRRLIHGAAAGAFGQVVTIAGQLVSVPLLLAAWGPRIYGDWLLLTAAPLLLSFLDLGLVQATSNRMTALAAAGKDDEARQLLDLTWSCLLALGAILGVVAAVAVWGCDVRSMLGVRDIGDSQARLILLAGIGWVLVGLPAGALQCGFRAKQRYAEGMWWFHISRGAEICASLIAACLGGPLPAALLLLAVRIATAFGLVWRLRQLSGLVPALRLPQMAILAPLLRPASAALGLTAANALSLQGTLIILGSQLDSTACAQYATLRTLSRLPIQACNMVLWPLQNEMARQYGGGNAAATRRLWRSASLGCLAIGLLAWLGLGLLGPYVYAVWTHGVMDWNPSVTTLLGAAAAAACLWSALAAPCIAGNAHLPLSIANLALVLLGLALLIPGLSRLPSSTLAAGMALAVDACLCWAAFRASRRTLRTEHAA